jgi:hypothetical protein
MYEALRDYGDRFDTVGIFTFEVDETGTITETGTSISSMLPYIQKWPHIKWLLTIMNHGIANIFTALRNNENGKTRMRRMHYLGIYTIQLSLMMQQSLSTSACLA